LLHEHEPDSELLDPVRHLIKTAQTWSPDRAKVTPLGQMLVGFRDDIASNRLRILISLFAEAHIKSSHIDGVEWAFLKIAEELNCLDESWLKTDIGIIRNQKSKLRQSQYSNVVKRASALLQGMDTDEVCFLDNKSNRVVVATFLLAYSIIPSGYTQDAEKEVFLLCRDKLSELRINVYPEVEKLLRVLEVRINPNSNKEGFYYVEGGRHFIVWHTKPKKPANDSVPLVSVRFSS